MTDRLSDNKANQQNDHNREVADILQPHLQEILGRPAIGEMDSDIRQQLTRQRILVTGAAGSIGTALAERLCQIKPQALALLDNHENTLFHLRGQLLQAHPEANPQFIIADVRNRQRMQAVLEENQPDVIFHLAAYKHVPLAEEWPQEFVQTNIMGTLQLGQLAAQAGVRKMVYTSTDKAVNPPSVYGATKRIAEIALRSLAQTGSATQYTMCRLVNVVGARGGVIETFARNILAGKPLTITDERMTRYWITMPEALYMLTGAACRDSSGDTLMLDVGEPLGIPEMARRIWVLLGADGRDFAPQYCGIRPGERLYEELNYAHESLIASNVPGLLEARRGPTAKDVSLDDLMEDIAALKRVAEAGDVALLRERLFTLVSEFK